MQVVGAGAVPVQQNSTGMHKMPAPATQARTTMPHEMSYERQRPSTPLVDALMERAAREDITMHVPGHKKGHNIGFAFQKLLHSGVLRHDLTELPGLDYLTSPNGPILQAQQLAATTFHADRTWFLVNGSSVGVHAAILAVAGPRDTLLVGRNCHQSAFAGMTLSGCEPWWLQPELDQELGLAHGISVGHLKESLAAAQAAGKRVTGVLVVSPTYYGSCSDIAGLASVCADADVALIVDEAHGAHFGVHPELPPSAMQLGADLAVQSTHKVLSSMTQSAMLHMRGQRVSAARVSRVLQMLQSSSPSYVLLASLDAARAHVDEPDVCLGEALVAAQIARAGLQQLPGLHLVTSGSTREVQPQFAGLHGPMLHDPLRLTVALHQLGMSGFQAAEELDGRHNIAVELANHKVVVCALGPGSTQQDAHALVAGFKHLTAHARQGSGTESQGASALDVALPIPVMGMTPRDAFFASSEQVPTGSTVGRICAELLCPYPPGVPVLLPGEVITSEAIACLLGTLAAGGTVTGAADGSLQTIMVVRH